MKHYLLSLIAFCMIGTLTAQTDTIAGWGFENVTKRGFVSDSATFVDNSYTADWASCPTKILL
jgi:hypothetical protein